MVKNHATGVDPTNTVATQPEDIYATRAAGVVEDDYVLMLEFIEPKEDETKKKKKKFAPSTLSPQQVKALVESRNATFAQAVEEQVDSYLVRNPHNCNLT
jgi:hypothetical protein